MERLRMLWRVVYEGILLRFVEDVVTIAESVGSLSRLPATVVLFVLALGVVPYELAPPLVLVTLPLSVVASAGLARAFSA